jgi:antitoxin component YwqK of YwqJK toxin-antitoxin module
MTTFAGCATAGASTAGKAVATTQKVAKQRTVVTKVPVLVKETSFYSDGLVDQYIVYKLDDAKKLLLEKATYDGSRSDPVERLVFEYKDGRETVETVYESDGKVRNRRESVYDDKGALVSERVLDSKGAIQSSSSYTYDAKGRKTEWRVLDASGSVKASTSYAYGKDSLSGIEMKDVGGKVTGTIKLEYAAGKLDKRSYFDPDGALQKYEAYVYSGELLSSLESHRADGSLEAKIVYEYGDSGQLVKASEYDASGALRSSTSYEYIVREDSSTETYYE